MNSNATKIQTTAEWKQNSSHNSNNSLHYIVKEPEFLETNSNFDISTSSNSSKVNVADLSRNKSADSETTDAKIQQETTQLHNNSSKMMDHAEIKPLTDITVNLEDVKPGCYIDLHIHIESRLTAVCTRVVVCEKTFFNPITVLIR